uniref:Uncharacterized protein n=1 Tax=Vespula pensylvanica TaxID=30213 RepID=A0A834KGH9_VESPE|nr:hypothetical protein H0235_015078 [Vespula pensylvanica]
MGQRVREKGMTNIYEQLFRTRSKSTCDACLTPRTEDDEDDEDYDDDDYDDDDDHGIEVELTVSFALPRVMPEKAESSSDSQQ